MGVMHDRERIVNHRICVNITFEVEGQNQLEALKKIWKSKDIIISKLGSVYQTYTMDYLLIGDIDAMYIEELMNKANSLVTMDAVDVRYSSKTNSSSKRTFPRCTPPNKSNCISISLHNHDFYQKSEHRKNIIVIVVLIVVVQIAVIKFCIPRVVA